jgi:hypothetical protein
MSSHTIYISNKTKLISTSDLSCMITACNALLPVVCKYWNIYCPIITQLPASIPINTKYYVFNLVDTEPVFYKSTAEIVENILAKTILENGGVVLYKDDTTPTVASALFHEICETLIDPVNNSWWVDVRSDTHNPTFYASEICNPVQNNIIKIIVGSATSHNGINVGLCDFVLPSWKNGLLQSGQFNYADTLKSPFTMSEGGYLIQFTPAQGVTQIFGTEMPNWLQNVKKESKRHKLL